MLYLSASQITAYYECPRKWYYSYVLRKTKPGNAAMNKGSYFHLCHELFYRDNIALGDLPARVLELQPEYEPVANEVFGAFIRYTEDNPNLRDEIIELDGKKACEVDFELQLADDITIRGKIDRIQQKGVRKYITDLKVTSSYLNDQFFSKFEMCIQAMIYSLVGRETFDRMDGFLIDAIQIGKKYDNQVQFFPLLPTIDQFIAELHRVGKGIIANRENEDYFTHNYSSCINRYGKHCSFFEVCRAPISMQQKMLDNGDFVSYVSPYDAKTKTEV